MAPKWPGVMTGWQVSEGPGGGNAACREDTYMCELQGTALPRKHGLEGAAPGWIRGMALRQEHTADKRAEARKTETDKMI